MRQLYASINNTIQISILLILFGLFFTTSCDDNDDEKKVNPVTVQFKGSSKTVSEVTPEENVTLTLAAPVEADATIEVNITASNATYATDFATIPNGSSGKFFLNLIKGQTTAQFKLASIDDALLNEARQITFTLANPSSALTLGTQSTFLINLTDDEGPTAVNFETTTSASSEIDAESEEIELVLTSPAPGNGTIEISFTSATATYNTHFTTEPAATNNKFTIDVATGDLKKTFRVKPKDDGDVNAPREIEFTITNATEGVSVGTVVTHKHTIGDNETPSTATFTAENGTMIEEDAEKEISITLAPATNAPGTIELTLNSDDATYGTHFTTIPALTNGKITIAVPTNASTVTFKVVPIDNGDVNDNREIDFTLASSTGVVVVGDASKTFSLTLADDDKITTIADLRAMYSGSNVTLAPVTKIRGVVISNNNNVTARNIFLQDATAGIQVRFDGNNVQPRGEDIVLNLSNVVLSAFSGNLQIALPNAKATSKGNVALPAYQTITVAEYIANKENYESELVQFENVGFSDADGTITMNGNRTASDGTNQFVVRTESYAPWNTAPTIEKVPYGIGTIRGVATENNGTVQVLPMVFAEDIALSTTGRNIAVTQAITNFGSVNKASVSASQQYTVLGTNLATDLTVVAPSNFEVSKNNTAFSSSITFTAMEAASSPTVYVRFAPNSGINQPLEGKITHKSIGAVSQTFNVNGTETGNTGGTLFLIETFNYAAADQSDLVVSSGSNWAITGTANANKVDFTTTPLTMTNYPGSNVGGAASIDGNGEDVSRTFSNQNAGTVYYAALVNIATVNATGDYFLHFKKGTTSFHGRLFAKSDGATGLNFGIQKTSGTGATVSYTTTSYALGTTYLVVVKFDFAAQSASLFVLNNVSATEPAADAVESGSSTSVTEIDQIGIRQGSTTPKAIIDAIRVAPTWSDLF